ncbi:MAG: hypothetical protein JNL81_10455 [Hyphomonadaceae bacterium]|nr:hypothetical protein [Hyphomonadaceae bacterium]
MMKRSVYVFAALAACMAFAACQPPTQAPAETTAIAANGDMPANVGDCSDTSVGAIGPRLEGLPDSGSAIQYSNGGAQVSYDVVPAINQSQPGDAIRLCLVSIPENCPPGDDRGRVYTATNARTGGTWTLPDSQHMCGGA